MRSCIPALVGVAGGPAFAVTRTVAPTFPAIDSTLRGTDPAEPFQAEAVDSTLSFSSNYDMIPNQQLFIPFWPVSPPRN